MRYADNPGLWRERAEETRTQAEHMVDPECRRIMLEIAEGYERMAERAARRLRAEAPPLTPWEPPR